MLFHHQLKQSIIWRGFYFATLLLVNIFLSRFLQASETGIVFYVANFFSLLVVVLSFNLDGSFIFFSSGEKIHHNRLALLAMTWTAVIGLLIYLLLPIYYNSFDTDISIARTTIAKFGLYYVVGILLSNYFTALFYSLGNYFLPNIIMGGLNILFIGIIFFGAFTHTSAGNIVSDYFLFILIQGIALGLCFIVKQKTYTDFRLPTIQQSKELLHYSSVSLLGNFIFFFVYRIDYWFVKTWCSNAADLGNYIQASKLSQLLLILPQIMASSIFPQMASGKQKEEVVSGIIKLFKLFFLLYIVIIIVIVITGKWLLPLIFGSSFNNMFIPMLILLPGIFCLSVSALLSAYFSGKKQNRFNVYAAALALLIMAVLSFTLKSRYNIYIAALISSLAYCCEFLFCFIKFKQQESLLFRDFIHFKKEDWIWFKQVLKV